MATSIGTNNVGGGTLQQPVALELMSQQPGLIGAREDWTGLTSPAERRKIQNRLNQRARRKRRRKEVKLHCSPSFKSTAQKDPNCNSDDNLGSTCIEISSVTRKSSQSDLWCAFNSAIGALGPEQGNTARVCKLTDPATQKLITEFGKWAQNCLTMGSPKTDHLLFLIKFNVFRALISNSRDLGFKPEDTTPDDALSPFTDSLSASNHIQVLPSALRPTKLQRQTPHHPWIDLLPIPAMRDNLLPAGDSYDDMELCGDLVGFFSASTGRMGMVIWGEPWDEEGWEVTEEFLSHWAWTVKGCSQLLESTNRWRERRGEEPLKGLEKQVVQSRNKILDEGGNDKE